jgi:Di-haem cytochrome c peroxidase
MKKICLALPSVPIAACLIAALGFLSVGAVRFEAQGNSVGERQDGKRLFERETFGGNGRTCLTCHSLETGTVSPEDAQARFQANPNDPLFRHDGSDDGQGTGVSRMLKDATILITLPLPSNISIKDDPNNPRTITVRRGIPTTLNTPALDPVLMLDGRAPTLAAQAGDAIHSHAQNTQLPSDRELQRIAEFQVTDAFFTSKTLRDYAHGGPYPELPPGNTDSEKRGRTFFEDVPFDFSNPKAGACAFCHTGPMLNEMSRFAPPFLQGVRFQSVLVSEFNALGNPAPTFVFTNPDGSKAEVTSPDLGRALITGRIEDANAFKNSILWGVGKTAPYFHDNSAKTLEDLVKHYSVIFSFFGVNFNDQDREDMVAYLKLLN